ncbi:MAG: GntR family transcriptional regulator [Propionibacteriaceae bacterium]
MATEELEVRVDRSDVRPLHAQIRDILHQQIKDQVLVPGDAIPTEEELQQQFGVSRSVVRQALASLSDLGLIHRQRGRGSVVAATPVLRRFVNRVGGLDEQAAARGQRLRTQVLGVEPAIPPEEARGAFGTDRCWEIERIRYLEQVPVSYERHWVPRDLFPHFTTSLLQGASLLALMRDHGYPAAGGPRHVQAVAAEPEAAGALDVSIGSPLLLLEGVTQDVNGRSIHWFNVWHRANTVFDLEAHAPSATSVVHERLAELRNLADNLQSAITDLETQTPRPAAS